MKSTFVEQTCYSLNDLATILQLQNEKEAKDILTRLLQAGIVKPKTKRSTFESVDEAIQAEIPEFTSLENPGFQFVYVGIIEINGHVIKSIPKFIKREANVEDMRNILYAAERSNADYFSLSTSFESDNKSTSNQLALALHIIRDYFSYGLYTNHRIELVSKGQGEIDWEATINTTIPAIQNNRPYYFDYYTNDITQDDTDYITRLHACIITECSYILKECELDEILQLETPTPYQGTRIDFGTDEYIVQRLYREMNIQFVTRNQAMLHNLINWVEKKSGINTELENMRMFGTNSFNTLWEKMCATVFESQYKNTPIGSLGITLLENENGDNTLNNLISRPTWKFVGLQGKIEPETLRPDYVRLIRANGHGHFVILDAKYYDIEIKEKQKNGQSCIDSIQGQPGIEDVCKQYLYQLAYHDFIKNHHLIPINAFVIPSDKAESYVAGTVTMPIFDQLLDHDKQPLFLNPIPIVMLSAQKVFKNYIAGTPLRIENEVPSLFQTV